MDLTEVQKQLGVEFKNQELLLEALTHSSCLNELSMGFHRSNEALAWLGDALIQWVTSESIFNLALSKGELSEIRKLYVNKKYLAEHAIDLGLDNVLIMPEHRVKEVGRKNQKNLHTVFEAVVGQCTWIGDITLLRISFFRSKNQRIRRLRTMVSRVFVSL